MTELAGLHFQTGQPIRVTFQDKWITKVEPILDSHESSHLWLAPSFVDLQVNGIDRTEFVQHGIMAERVAHMCRAMTTHGVARFCPTITTLSESRLTQSLTAIREAVDNDAQARQMICGVHLEGPYISKVDGPRGAHPLEHCRAPDWDEFQRLQEASDHLISMVTLSPEYSEAPDFIRSCVSHGVRVAIGHTNASSEQIAEAVDAGATLSTHLGNGAHAMIRRHPNYLWDQLSEDRLAATLIVDGHHLPPEFVKCAIRCKPPGMALLVSDMTGLCGVPPGQYESPTLGNVEVIDDGKIVIAGQREYLAGASRAIWHGVRNLIRWRLASLSEALAMATTSPARWLGIEAGSLTPGQRADLLEIEYDADRVIEPDLKRIWFAGQAITP